MDAVGPVAAAWLLLMLPGYVLLALVRRPFPFRLGLAPAATCALVALGVTLAHLLGIAWNAETAAATLALGAGIAWAAGRLLPGGGRLRTTLRPASVRVELLTLVGALCGAAAIVLPARAGMGSIDTLNGSYDSFFHLSALRYVTESRDAFPGTAMAPLYGGRASFYPTIWHGLAVLLPFDVITSANATMLGSLAAFPFTVAALLRVIVPVGDGPSRTVRAVIIAVVAAASSLFRSLPTMGLVLGLWPYTLSVAVLPATFALCLLAAGIGGEKLPLAGRYERVLPVLVALAAVVGTVLTHPTTMFNLLVLGLSGWLARILTLGRRAFVRAALEGAVLVLLVLAVGVASFSRLASMALTAQAPHTWLTTLLVSLADRPRIRAIPLDALPIVPLLVAALAGAIVAVMRQRRVQLGALVTAVVAIGLVYAGQSDHDVLAALANPWYGARERIAPLLAMSLLVLAAGGLSGCAGVAARARVRTVPEDRHEHWRPLPEGDVRDTAGPDDVRDPPHRASARIQAVTVAVVACLMAAATLAGAASPVRTRLIGSLAYVAYGKQLQPYVTPAERAFIESSGRDLAPGSVVLGDPLDGASLYWALDGVHVVYPSLAMPQSLEQRRIGRYADELAEDPNVCAALKSAGVTHVYRDTGVYSGEALGDDLRDATWAGVRRIGDAHLRLVDSEGDWALYELVLPDRC